MAHSYRDVGMVRMVLKSMLKGPTSLSGQTLTSMSVTAEKLQTQDQGIGIRD